ncbi:MAG: hypothetical protein ABTQ32_21050 [Myxococcaceae bacterium]
MKRLLERLETSAVGPWVREGDDDDVFRSKLLHGFSALMVALFGVATVVRLFRGDLRVALINALCVTVLVTVVGSLRRGVRLELAVRVLAWLVVVLLLGLYWSGAQPDLVLLWGYVIPPLTIMLAGARSGGRATLAFALGSA